MNNNTIVTACNQNYFWGVFILAASLRRGNMPEELLLYCTGFSPEQKKLLGKFSDVTYIEAPASQRNMTCRKAEAMLAADSEFITWADGDGFFVGNCSDLLAPPCGGKIHFRLRSREENGRTFDMLGLYSEGDSKGDIPQRVLEQWSKDIGERTTPRNRTCGSACFLALHRDDRAFLEHWNHQMLKVLPDRDVGVVNFGEFAYRQLDESVLNSLLCFGENAPEVSEFQLDKFVDRRYRHVVGYPKPWQCWSAFSLNYYDEIMDVMSWCIERGIITAGELPFALRPGHRRLHRLYAKFGSLWLRGVRKLRGVLKW